MPFQRIAELVLQCPTQHLNTLLRHSGSHSHSPIPNASVSALRYGLTAQLFMSQFLAPLNLLFELKKRHSRQVGSLLTIQAIQHTQILCLLFVDLQVASGNVQSKRQFAPLLLRSSGAFVPHSLSIAFPASLRSLIDCLLAFYFIFDFSLSLSG